LNQKGLHTVLDRRLISLLNTRSSGDNGAIGILRCGCAGVPVEFEEAGDVEPGLLQHLDLADADVVHRVHTLAGLVDFLADGLNQEFVHQILQVARASLTLDDLEHLGADQTDLRALCVRGFADLVLGLAGEADDEDAQHVAVGGLDINEGFDQRLPLLDEAAQFVCGEVHAVEVGEEVAFLDVLGDEFDLAVCRLILLEVVEANVVHTAHEAVLGQLQTLRLGDDGIADLALGLVEVGRALDVVPFLLGEDVIVPLLVPLFPLVQFLVLSDRHGERRQV